jgi:FixJ family two-component response regulator
MSEQVRRNEDRFYRYPMRRVVAVIDDDAGVRAALEALRQAGVDVRKVNVLTGPEGARLLDSTGTRRGLRARLLRLAQLGAYEGNALQAHDRALEDGHHVVFVPVRGDRSRVIDVLRTSGGSYLLYFGLWSIEVL